MNVKIVELIKNVIKESDENRIKWKVTGNVYHYRTSGGVDLRISCPDFDVDGIYSLGIEFKGLNHVSDYSSALVRRLYDAARDNVWCQEHLWEKV